MFDPEQIFEPLILEMTDSIQKMRKVKQIDDKMKYSTHIEKLTGSFANIVSAVQSMAMADLAEMDEDFFDEDDDDDDLF